MRKSADAQKRVILLMATLTLVVMPLVGWVISLFSNEVLLWDRWVGDESIWTQVFFGVAAGVTAGFLARGIIALPFMEPVRNRYAERFADLDLSALEIVFISICAGVGEELLFRGALQPVLGIVITSIVFVAIHGYLNPKDWRVSVYGLYMTLIIFGFGFMTEAIGIWSAVIAHTLVDIILLADLGKEDE